MISHKKGIFYIASEKNIFVEQELGWVQMEEKDAVEFLNRVRPKKITLIYFLGNNKSELDFLNRIPPLSVWVWLYGDETFEPRLNFRVINKSSVIGVIRPYPILREKFLKNLALYFAYIFTETSIRVNSVKSAIQIFKYSAASLIRIFRLELILILNKVFGKENINFIPGYTNLFAETLTLHFGSNVRPNSLLRFGVNTNSNAQRIYDFGFLGQYGSPNRMKAIRVLESFSGKSKTCILLRDNFGGTLGSYGVSTSTSHIYIRRISESRFSLCPSGNYSSATFRWLESVILGTIPIQSYRTPSDPSFRIIATYSLGTHEKWQTLLDRALGMSEEQRMNCLEKIISSVESAIITLNLQLSKGQDEISEDF